MILVSKIIIILSGMWLVAVSAIMMLYPKLAIRIIGMAGSTNFINYTELTLRGIWGIALLVFYQHALYPQLFYYFGIFICISTFVLFLTPRKWHARYAMYWANRLTPKQMRLYSPFSLLLGILLIYSVV
jgi:hypothetical protein